MYAQEEKPKKNKSLTVTNTIAQKQSIIKTTSQFVDNRYEATAQRKLQEIVNNSPQVKRLRTIQEMANNSPQVKQLRAFQEMANNSLLINKTTQLHGHAVWPQDSIYKNKNSIPDNHNPKSGVEQLTGLEKSDVTIHCTSPKPTQLKPYTHIQGTDIRIATGLKKNLYHEAWHQAQQKQNLAKPPMQMTGKVTVNDSASLEKETDKMEGKVQRAPIKNINPKHLSSLPVKNILQAVWENINGPYYKWDKIQDGLQWYCSKETGEMYFTIVDESVFSTPEELIFFREQVGAHRNLEKWLSDADHWEKGNYHKDDLQIVEPKEIEEEEWQPTNIPKREGKSGISTTQHQNFKKSLEQLTPSTPEQIEATQEHSNTVLLEIAKTNEKHVNFKCNQFAQNLQERLDIQGIKFIPLFIALSHDTPKPTDISAIKINEPGHPFHQQSVGVDCHYATMVRTQEGKDLIFDNHHPNGMERSLYISSLHFEFARYAPSLAEIKKETSSVLLTQGSIIVFIADPSKMMSCGNNWRSMKKSLKAAAYYQDLA